MKRARPHRGRTHRYGSRSTARTPRGRPGQAVRDLLRPMPPRARPFAVLVTSRSSFPPLPRKTATPAFRAELEHFYAVASAPGRRAEKLIDAPETWVPRQTVFLDALKSLDAAGARYLQHAPRCEKVAAGFARRYELRPSESGQTAFPDRPNAQPDRSRRPGRQSR